MFREQWHSIHQHWRITCNKTLFSWLADSGSFTKRLRTHTGKTVTVKIISQAYGIPTLSEQQYLSLNKKTYALIREVYLYSDAKPWLYARTVIPVTHLTGKFSRLKNWGNVEIGKFLFANPAIQRSEFEIAELAYPDYYYQQAIKVLQQQPDTLWARRSLFTLGNHSLLLTEVFMKKF